MLSSRVKPAVVAAITPISRLALRVGMTANGVSIVGALGVVASALYFYPRGQFFLGTIVISLFVLSDLFDGTMARISHSAGTRWGAFLDSTIDRASDGAIVLSLALYFHTRDEALFYLALSSFIIGFLIPYIRAKAESLGVECSVGIAERTERLILILVAVGLHGLGVSYVLATGLWSVSILGFITIIQRVLVVRRSLQ